MWLGPAAADAEEQARLQPRPPPVQAAGVPGAGARVAAPVSTWPNVQVALPESRVAVARAGPLQIPRSTRLENATTRGAVVLGHEPLSIVGAAKQTERQRPCSGSMRAMHRMIEHLEARKAVLTKIFRDYDKDGSGSIDRDELSSGLRALGLRLSRDEIDGVMAYLDTDGGGDVDLGEFLEHFKEIRAERGFAARLSQKQALEASAAKQAPSDSGTHRPSSASQKAMARMIDHLVDRKAVLTKMFREFDTDHSGTIDKEELDHALINLGLRLNGDELQGVMDYLDTDGGGDIDLEEFIEHFKIERAKRFEGYIPELKQAKLQLLTHLKEGKHVVIKRNGKPSCSPESGRHHGLYRVLTAIERLQSLENLSSENAASMRGYIQGLLQRGIQNTTPDELEVLQHMHRLHAPYIPQGSPWILGPKGPRFGEGQTQKRLVRLPAFFHSNFQGNLEILAQFARAGLLQ